MKNKKIFIIALLLFIVITSMSNVYAIMLDLNITGKTKVEVNKSINLTAILDIYNDMYIPDEPDGGMGKTKSEDVTKEVVWTSSNTSVATVNSNGKVTGISSGKVTITAKYDNNWKDTISIIVGSSQNTEPVTPEKDKNESEKTPPINPENKEGNTTTEVSKDDDEIVTTIVTSPIITPEFEEESNNDDTVEMEGEEIYIYDEDTNNNNSPEIYEVQGDNTTNYSAENEKNFETGEIQYSENILIINDEDFTEEPSKSDKEIYAELDNSDFIAICITTILIIILLVISIIILCRKADKFKKANDKKFILTSIIIAIILLSVILYCKITTSDILEKESFALDSDNKFILDDKGTSTIPLGGLGTINNYLEIDLDNKSIDYRYDSETLKIKDDGSFEIVESLTGELKMRYYLNDNIVNKLEKFFIKIKNLDHKSNFASMDETPNYYYLLETKDADIIIEDEKEIIELKQILSEIDEIFSLYN